VTQHVTSDDYIWFLEVLHAFNYFLSGFASHYNEHFDIQHFSLLPLLLCLFSTLYLFGDDVKLCRSGAESWFVFGKWASREKQVTINFYSENKHPTRLSTNKPFKQILIMWKYFYITKTLSKCWRALLKCLILEIFNSTKGKRYLYPDYSWYKKWINIIILPYSLLFLFRAKQLFNTI